MVAAGVSLRIESALPHIGPRRCIYIYIYTFHRFDLRPAINLWLISLAWGGEEGCKVGKLVRVPRYRKQMLSVHVLLDTSAFADPLLGLL